MVEPITTTIAAAAAVEGVRFLYGQATEVLRAWRARRRDGAAPPPQILPPPEGVTVVPAGRPVADAPNRETEDVLHVLVEALGPVKDGAVPADDVAARRAAGELRELLEQVLRASIHFEGEPERKLEIRDVKVVAQRVSKDVYGIRASLDKLAGTTTIAGIEVHGSDAESVGGVDLR